MKKKCKDCEHWVDVLDLNTGIQTGEKLCKFWHSGRCGERLTAEDGCNNPDNNRWREESL